MLIMRINHDRRSRIERLFRRTQAENAAAACCALSVLAAGLIVLSAGEKAIGAGVPESKIEQTAQTVVLSEQRALNEMLLSGPRAAALRAQLGISKAAYAQATVLPNPSIEFDNGYAELSYWFGITVPIEPPWKLVLRLLAAKANVGTAVLQMQQSLWALRGECRRAYTEYVIAAESEVMMRELAELTRQLALVAQKRFQAGDVARLDVYKAELAQQLLAQENIIKGQVALAYRKLLNTRENIRKYQEGVIAQSERVAELGRTSYRLGQADITAALNAQQANIQIRNLYLTEILNYQQAFTDLEQAVGRILI